MLAFNFQKLHKKYLCQQHFIFNDFKYENKNKLKLTAILHRSSFEAKEQKFDMINTFINDNSIIL